MTNCMTLGKKKALEIFLICTCGVTFFTVGWNYRHLRGKGVLSVFLCTPVITLKRGSDVSGIRTLLQHGANTMVVNEYGETALDYLKDNKVKKENSDYWDVFELYNQIAESDAQKNNAKDNYEHEKD